VPNYLYKCEMCSTEEILTLPISTDPKQTVPCPSCGINLLTRRIGASNFICNPKRTLGQWYKDETGKELLGD
jgi:putative FmdB family regulatory protein